MAWLLAVLFLVVPVVEIAVIIQVGHAIGPLNTVVLLILVSLLGGWLVKREGLGIVRRISTAVQTGRVPGRELADGALILLAGALLLTPGFVSDILGILLLLPPVRAVVRPVLIGALTKRAIGGTVSRYGRTIDVE